MLTAFRLTSILIPVLATTIAAHNGSIAVATPVSVAIDGDLSDWPRTATWYPINIHGYGSPLRDGEDLTARFAVGYNLKDRSLLVGVEVQDESIVEGGDGVSSPPWDAQDGCEIYIDPAHDDEGAASVQHSLYGGNYVARLPQGTLLQEWGDVRHSVRRAEGRHTYEWEIRLQSATGATRSEAGMPFAMAFDIAICDRDEDGTFTWASWGLGGVKARYPTSRGDLILVDDADSLGTVHLQVQRDSGMDEPSRRLVRMQRSGQPASFVEARADAQGWIQVPLPVGNYEAFLSGTETDPASVTSVRMQPGLVVTDTLRIGPAVGDRVEAGPGSQFIAGAGHLLDGWLNWGVSDGLPTAFVLDLHQDRHGNLWLATSRGVARYDGFTFTTYTTEDGLAGDHVTAIAEDPTGDLWFGTMGDGLSRYDGQHFTTYTTAHGLASNMVYALRVNRSGDLWIGTQGSGISRFDGAYFTNISSADGLGGNIVFQLEEDDTGAIWVAQQAGGLSRWSSGQISHFTGESMPGATSAMAVLADGTSLWVAGIGELGHRVGDTWRAVPLPEPFSSERVRALVRGADGTVYAGGLAGLLSIDPDGTVTTHRTDTVVNDVLVDEEGSLWIATSAHGLSRWAARDFHHLTAGYGLPRDLVYDLHIGRNDTVWIGSPGGLSHYDGATVRTLTGTAGLLDANVLALGEDRDGVLWAGTQAGLCRIGDGVVTLTISDDLPDRRVVSLGASSDGCLWVRTKGGLSHVCESEVETLTTFDGHEVSGASASMQVDEDDIAWLTVEDGLQRWSRFGQEAVPFEVPPIPVAINALHVDRQQRLWLGTDRGIRVFGKDGPAQLTVHDGLANNRVITIREDDAGRIWFGTDGGVSVCDGQVVQSLTRADGFPLDNVVDVEIDGKGDLWFAGRGGVVRYRPGHSRPRIEIADVESTVPKGSVSRLHIPDHQDRVTIDFRGWSLKTRRDALVYRYRLLGNHDWRTTRERGVTYADLARGDYVFEVQAVDRDLGYSDVAQVQISVQTSWAYLGIWALTAAALLGAVVSTGYGIRRRLERDRAVAERSLALEQANERLRETDELKSDFVANVSHELRTPLTAMRSAVDNMLDGITGDLTPSQEEYLERLKANGTRLTRLIEDLLDLSRIEAGHMEVRPITIQLAEVARTVLEMMTPLAAERQVELRLDEVGPGQAAVLADPDRLQQVLVNLVNNAVKFTPAGGQVLIEIQGEKDPVHICVVDTGPGIPASELDRIFDKFHQIHGANGPRGAGIGLSIARSLVQLQGGRIWAESEEGSGSRFCFELPVAPATV